MGHSFSAQIYFSDWFLNKKFSLKYQHFVTVLPFYPHAQLLKWNWLTHSACLVMWALCIRMGQTGKKGEGKTHCSKGPLFIREDLSCQMVPCVSGYNVAVLYCLLLELELHKTTLHRGFTDFLLDTLTLPLKLWRATCNEVSVSECEIEYPSIHRSTRRKLN